MRPLPFRDGLKWGWINVDGGVICPAECDYASDFSEGVTFVRRGNECLLLDKSFRTVATVKEKEVYSSSQFHEGLLVLTQKDTYKDFYIDIQGRHIFDKEFDTAFDFSAGRAAVEVGEKWGFIDKCGRWVIEPQFDAVRRFTPGSHTTRVYIPHGGGCGYCRLIDRQGKFVTARKFVWLGVVAQGLVPFRRDLFKQQRYGVADEQGNEVFPPTSTECDQVIWREKPM